MSRFTLPRDIYYGKGSLEQLKNLDGKKAVLVLGGGSMKKFGFVDKVLAYLKEAGMETALFEGVEPDPSVDTVLNGAVTDVGVFNVINSVIGDGAPPSFAIIQNWVDNTMSVIYGDMNPIYAMLNTFGATKPLSNIVYAW